MSLSAAGAVENDLYFERIFPSYNEEDRLLLTFIDKQIEHIRLERRKIDVSLSSILNDALVEMHLGKLMQSEPVSYQRVGTQT